MSGGEQYVNDREAVSLVDQLLQRYRQRGQPGRNRRPESWRPACATVPVRVQPHLATVPSASGRIGAGGTKLGRSKPFSVSLASQTASSLSVLGRPGTFLTSRASTSCTSSPAASSR